MSRIIGTIEARMGSIRLPGKTMAPLYNGMTLLECVVKRLCACRTLDDVVVATTIEKNDDIIADWCKAYGVSVFRGSEDDVLERVSSAASYFKADAIVQMGADSAYLDYELIDQLVGYYQLGQYDYVCNDLKLTYPLGIYGHVVRVTKLLELTHQTGLSDKDRSDVVRYFWEHPQSYSIFTVEAPPELHDPELRLTIDYPEDMEQARNVYTHFGGHLFSTSQVIALKQQKPEWFRKTKGLLQQSAPFLNSPA